MSLRTQVEDRIRGALPGADVAVRDLTGTDNHFAARVVSPDFSGLAAVARHKLVYAPLRDWIADNTVHALAVETLTPEESSHAS